MILLVDVGNSRLKWRLQHAGTIHASGALALVEWQTFSSELANMSALNALQHAVVSSVAGAEVTAQLDKVLAKVLVRENVHWLRASANGHGLSSAYQPPQSLGPDRFAALVAARHRAPVAWMVANVGTAMTVDALSAGGRFLGGCIVPGPELMRTALAQGTASVNLTLSSVLPTPAAQDGEAVAMAWPHNTPMAVTQGVGLALAGLVEQMVQRLRSAEGEAPKVLLSGGGRGAVRPFLPGDVTEVDELVLEGLAWVARDLGLDA